MFILLFVIIDRVFLILGVCLWVLILYGVNVLFFLGKWVFKVKFFFVLVVLDLEL